MKHHPHPQHKIVAILLQVFITFVFISAFAYAVKRFTSTTLPLETLGITVFASTVFLVFVAYDTPMAHERHIFFSYIFAITIGIITSFFLNHIIHCTAQICTEDNILIFSAAISGVLTFLAMTLLSCEHPPAIGLAIGFSLAGDSWDIRLALILMAGIIVLIIAKSLLSKRILINLMK